MDEAISWLISAANLGHGPAAGQLGFLCAAELRDPPEATRWFEMAATAGDDYGLRSLVTMIIQGSATLPEDRQMEWLRKAADLGLPAAVQELQRRGK